MVRKFKITKIKEGTVFKADDRQSAWNQFAATFKIVEVD